MISKKILLVFGGPSSEREISIKTADAVEKALLENSHKVIRKEFSKDFSEDLKNINPDLVFNAMHGAFGEDGKLQGMLECLGFQYTHSNSKASAIAMDKDITKKLVSLAGVKSPKSIIVTKENFLEKNTFNPPYVIKPLSDGSSIGVKIIKKSQDLTLDNLKSGVKYLIEEFIEGREITVAVLNGKSLGVLEIIPDSGVYDYSSKYTLGKTQYLVPAELEEEAENNALGYASTAHSVIGCSGITRTDMIIDKNNEVYFLEINTHPGMTETSLVPKIANYYGLSFKELVQKIVEASI